MGGLVGLIISSSDGGPGGDFFLNGIAPVALLSFLFGFGFGFCFLIYPLSLSDSLLAEARSNEGVEVMPFLTAVMAFFSVFSLACVSNRLCGFLIGGLGLLIGGLGGGCGGRCWLRLV